MDVDMRSDDFVLKRFLNLLNPSGSFNSFYLVTLWKRAIVVTMSIQLNVYVASIKNK